MVSKLGLLLRSGTKGCAVLTAGAALLGGCASIPEGSALSLDPGLAAGDKTFAIVDAGDGPAKAAVPYVEQRLQALGFEPSQNPDLLVEVSAAQRPRSVGAYVPGECTADAVSWVETPEDNWLIGGGQVLTLNVRLIDAQTGAPLYQGSARRRAASGFDEGHAKALALAALADDPRQAPRRTAPAC